MTVLLLATAMMGAVPAHGQTIRADRAASLSTRQGSDADRARETMNAFGICVVRTKLTAVRRALQQANDGLVNAALAELATSDCLSEGQLQMSAALMRGSVYRALYLRDFRRVTPNFGSVPAASDGADLPLRRFGACVIERDPANANAIVLAGVASEAEKRAFAAIMPALSDCIAPGDRISFSRTVLQGVLAEAAYRRASISAAVNR